MAMPAEPAYSKAGPYTHFQLIAYEVPTAAENAQGVGLPAWFPGTFDDIGDLMQYAKDPVLTRPEDCNEYQYLDALSRLRRLAYVAEIACVTKHWQEGALKIFVVPEFYFRPIADEHYSYSHSLARQIFQQLSAIFSDKVFSDWIFVCGTVVHHKKAGRKDVFYNTAVVVSGGMDEFVLLRKQQTSDINDIYAASVPRPIGLPQALKSLTGQAANNRHFVLMKGVELGLEISLEHRFAVQRGRIELYGPTDSGNLHPGVQLQIVTAAGISPSKLLAARAITARAGGYLLRVDGFSKSPSQLLRVTSWSGPAEGPAYLSSVASTVKIPAAKEVPINSGQVRVQDPPDEWNTFVQQQGIVFYPSERIPQ